MRHSWQELADGTASCRRCPAVKVRTQRPHARHVEMRTFNDAAYMGSAYDYELPVEMVTMGAAEEVVGAHPMKCGRVR